MAGKKAKLQGMAEINDYHFLKILRSIHPTAKGRRKIAPERQGQLDSLCGVYCIVNAVHLVCPLTAKHKAKLFKRLIMTLHKQEYVTKALLGGTYKKHIDTMLETAAAYVAKKQGIKLAIEPLHQRNAKVGLKDYWNRLHGFIGESDRRSIIIGVTGRQ